MEFCVSFTAGMDYTEQVGVNSGIVTFIVGDTAGTERSITIQIIDDNIAEGDVAEFFTVTGSETVLFAMFSNGLTSDTVRVEITDNDGEL